MPSRNYNFISGEYYHVFNRGNDKRSIFLDKLDYLRFLYLITSSQSLNEILKISPRISKYIQTGSFGFEKDDIIKIIKDRAVTLVGFVLMPNHFHLILRQVRDKGVSSYMQKILNSYTKYFNTRRDRSGHLFQGPFKAVHIDDNEQLLYLSAYIHCNPREVTKWASNWQEYPWSSYVDYAVNNRWGGLLDTSIVLDQYSSKREYIKSVVESGAKDWPTSDVGQSWWKKKT